MPFSTIFLKHSKFTAFAIVRNPHSFIIYDNWFHICTKLYYLAVFVHIITFICLQQTLYTYQNLICLYKAQLFYLLCISSFFRIPYLHIFYYKMWYHTSYYFLLPFFISSIVSHIIPIAITLQIAITAIQNSILFFLL